VQIVLSVSHSSFRKTIVAFPKQHNQKYIPYIRTVRIHKQHYVRGRLQFPGNTLWRRLSLRKKTAKGMLSKYNTRLDIIFVLCTRSTHIPGCCRCIIRDVVAFHLGGSQLIRAYSEIMFASAAEGVLCCAMFNETCLVFHIYSATM